MSPEVERNTKRDVVAALEGAEQMLGIWAELLADDSEDREAAEALRLKSALCKYRCEITP